MDPITYGGPAGQISAEIPADDAVVTAQAPPQAADGRSVPAIAPLFAEAVEPAYLPLPPGASISDPEQVLYKLWIPPEVEARLNPGEIARAVFDREVGAGTEVYWAALTPVRSSGLVPADQGWMRLDTPLDVTVVLERIEAVEDRVVIPGGGGRPGVDREMLDLGTIALGEGEPLQLVPGDRVTVPLWAQNDSAGPLVMGVEIEGATVRELFGDSLEFVPTMASERIEGESRERFLAENAGEQVRGDHRVFFSYLESGEYGGMTLVGTVQPPAAGGALPPIRVRPIATRGPVPYEVGEVHRFDPIEGYAKHSHQQTQTYGHFAGELVFERGTLPRLVGPPGTIAYHGGAPGLDALRTLRGDAPPGEVEAELAVYREIAEANQMQAAYWTELRYALSSSGEAPSHLLISSPHRTARGGGGTPMAVEVAFLDDGLDMFENPATGRAEPIKLGYDFANKPMLGELRLEVPDGAAFLQVRFGGASMAAAIVEPIWDGADPSAQSFPSTGHSAR